MMREYGYRLSVEGVVLFQGWRPINEIMSVFREEDRLVSMGAPGRYCYARAVGQLRERLHVMGFTVNEAKAQVLEFAKHAGNPFWVIIKGDELRARRAMADEAHLLATIPFKEWRDTYIRLISEWNENGELLFQPRRNPFTAKDRGNDDVPQGTKSDLSSFAAPSGILDRYFFQFSSEELDAPISEIRCPFADSRSALQGMLSAFDSRATVYLDFTPLVALELMQPDARLSETAIEKLMIPAAATAPVVVLTEGRSDTEFSREALSVFFPI